MKNILADKKLNIKSYKIKLTVLTPLFISGGEDSQFANTGYVYDRKNRKIHILDGKKFAGLMWHSQRLFYEYIKFLKNPNIEGGKDLHAWLKSNNVDFNYYKDCVKYSVDAANLKQPRYLDCFIKNVDHKPYIPGSSIKGALRTAILGSMIRKDYYAFEKHWRNIRGNPKANSLEKEAFCKIEFPEDTGSNFTLEDVFRGIAVSDSQPLNPGESLVVEKIEMKNQKKKTTFAFLREFLKPGASTEFTLTINKNLTKFANLNDFHSVKSHLDNFSSFLLKPGQGLFDKYKSKLNQKITNFEKEKNKTRVCIGGGTGFLTKTVTYALAPSFYEGMACVKRILPGFHDHIHKDKDISPRVPRIATYKGEKHLIGWCSLEVVDELC